MAAEKGALSSRPCKIEPRPSPSLDRDMHSAARGSSCCFNCVQEVPRDRIHVMHEAHSCRPFQARGPSRMVFSAWVGALLKRAIWKRGACSCKSKRAWFSNTTRTEASALLEPSKKSVAPYFRYVPLEPLVLQASLNHTMAFLDLRMILDDFGLMPFGYAARLYTPFGGLGWTPSKKRPGASACHWLSWLPGPPTWATAQG